MSSLGAIMDALASQLQTELCGTANPLIPHLQVDGRLVRSPTPPAIDIFPGDPFQESMGFGPGNKEYYFTVRARVLADDHEGQQDLLLSMMDSQSNESVEQALYSDRSLGGVATVGSVEGPSAYGLFADPGPTNASLLGCTWRVRVIP